MEEETKGTRLVIGITGGVGAGKSTVLKILREEWSAEVIEADRVARELMEPGGRCHEAVLRAFGTEILSGNGDIDRGKLAAIVYASEDKRLLLNSLTHPLVCEEVSRRVAGGNGLIIYESALPREARMRDLCREIWYVRAPEEVRIRRLADSRGYSGEKSLEIMRSQLSDEAFRGLSDRVIENGGSVEETRWQLRNLMRSVTG